MSVEKEYLAAVGGDRDLALVAMAATIDIARARVEGCLADRGMGAMDLAQLWGDLHPNEPAHAGTPS